MDFLSWNDTIKLILVIMVSGVTIGATMFAVFVCWIGMTKANNKTSGELIAEEATRLQEEEDVKNKNEEK